MKSSFKNWNRLDIRPLATCIFSFVLLIIFLLYGGTSQFKVLEDWMLSIFLLFTGIVGLAYSIKYFRHQELKEFVSNIKKVDLKRFVHHISNGFEVIDLSQKKLDKNEKKATKDVSSEFEVLDIAQKSIQGIKGEITICKYKIINNVNDQTINLNFKYYHKLSYFWANLGPINKRNNSLANVIKKRINSFLK